ncbi:alpha-amylase family glycosyl hydrolase [Geobacter sp. AOG2]|uniref:alpha-amylase family glycosyl hydrolase n=1 Tax=Geobacter sp. AOG2 TaxID=1566347 RepID=UPI001CC7E82C|nr:alpha-amylase family glycosyl hydrolase [Geobacter sp. AOG2]GFE59832.1 alpha-amylase [Geobacter sp. AOG2]
MTELSSALDYFPHTIQISARYWRSLELGVLSQRIATRSIPPVMFYRQLAFKLNRGKSAEAPPAHAGHLVLYAMLLKVYRHLIDVLGEQATPGVMTDALQRGGCDPAGAETAATLERFIALFPPDGVLQGTQQSGEWLGAAGEKGRRMVLRELLLLRLAAQNPALDSFRAILDDRPLASETTYPVMAAGMQSALKQGPLLEELGCTLGDALWAPIGSAPTSLAGQLDFVRTRWVKLLPPELLEEVVEAFDILLEEEREWGGAGAPGPPPVLEFGRGGHGQAGGSSVFGGYDYPEYEGFSPDADWMSNVVLIAKMVYVWLDQLSKQYGWPITRLDQIPEAELDRLAAAGVTGLWLIGVWERSPASQRIKQLCGNSDAIASAYSLYDYEIAADLGGWAALGNLRERAVRRGIRLASDMVPNHTGIYSRWVIQHPDWFVQTDYPPFPTYQFNGEDLSHSGDACIQIEDGYWTKTDAAVVFRLIERTTGRIRYIYHGNDGTSIPWNDTAQLNYLIPEVREAVIQTILHVAHNFPIIRFDAAMTLAKKHYQRLWFPIRGLGGGIPSRAEHGMSREEFDTLFPVEFWREVVDRVAAEAPGTLLLAEAFWLMEGYFVRTLGMHRVYNSAFMNMLKTEENAKYRQTIKNVLEFNPEVLKRFVNFMNNPDEKTAVEQFGTQGKYFGACVLLATMPGLPMLGHGQIEGFHEKYGMEYKRAYWDEAVDEGLVRGHEMWIFPLLRRRWLFSGADNFVLYDFYAGHAVDENVFAYSNQVGEQRALVLYHNRYASCAGWIKDSAAFAVKTDGDAVELRRTTLGAALGVTAEDHVFYAFRDHTRNLEYVRNGRELAEKGLYVELGEYQFHVFMDFREIRDDAEGSWQGLCAALNGQGVENLEDELKQQRYASLNTAFRAVLQTVPMPDKDRPVAGADTADVIRAAQRFLAVLHAHLPGGVSGADAVLKEISAWREFSTAFRAMKPAAKIAQATHTGLMELLDSPVGTRVLLGWLLLKHAGGDALGTFGLDCTLRRVLQEDPGRDAALLLTLLLAWDDGQGGGGRTIATAFACPPCRDFMMIHESDGVEWFNKERFEELVAWLTVIGLVELALKRPASRTVSAWLAAAGRERAASTALAAHAGYRSSLFQQLSEPALEIDAESPAKHKRKGTDVQGGARAHTSKTPDDTLPR